jgi:hypothetical protein
MHLSKNQACEDCVTRSQNEKPAALNSPQSSPEEAAFPEDDGGARYSELKLPWGDCISHPWDTSEDDSDDSDSDDSADEPAVEEVNLPPAPGTDLSCHGVTFTNSDFMETKLLKILNDAHAPHFLYQDLLNWAKEAKRSKYDFLPKRSD